MVVSLVYQIYSRKMIKKLEILIKAIKEHPEENLAEDEEKLKVSMTLEEKVLDFINRHPGGVKIMDIEESLGEKRMRLGFVAKKLLDDGRVLKIETTYYPKTRI
jgi:hypothetical protein